MNYLRERMMAASPADVELEQEMRELPVFRRRVFLVLVIGVSIPWVFFSSLAEGFWFALRLGVALVAREIACGRRLWRR